MKSLTTSISVLLLLTLAMDDGFGCNPSKVTKEPKKNGVDQSTNIQEDSTGFHMLELHMPTAGMSLFTLLLVVAAAFLLHYLWRRFKRKASNIRREQNVPFDAWNTPMITFQQASSLARMAAAHSANSQDSASTRFQEMPDEPDQRRPASNRQPAGVNVRIPDF